MTSPQVGELWLFSGRFKASMHVILEVKRNEIVTHMTVVDEEGMEWWVPGLYRKTGDTAYIIPGSWESGGWRKLA
jgi:hypothetical protein